MERKLPPPEFIVSFEQITLCKHLEKFSAPSGHCPEYFDHLCCSRTQRSWDDQVLIFLQTPVPRLQPSCVSLKVCCPMAMPKSCLKPGCPGNRMAFLVKMEEEEEPVSPRSRNLALATPSTLRLHACASSTSALRRRPQPSRATGWALGALPPVVAA